MGADLDNSRHHLKFLISNLQFPIFNFPIFIFQFQSGITGIFFYSQTENFRNWKQLTKSSLRLLSPSRSDFACHRQHIIPIIWISARTSHELESEFKSLRLLCHSRRSHASCYHSFPSLIKTWLSCSDNKPWEFYIQHLPPPVNSHNEPCHKVI